MSVAAVVVTHGAESPLDRCIRSLVTQVDELVVVANLPGTTPPLPDGVNVIENRRPQGFAANANLGIRATNAPLVVVANPDTEAEANAVPTLRDFLASRPACGIAGPGMLYPDGRWQPSRRRFPTVSGTLVRRSPLRRLLRPSERQRSHYLLDERPAVPVETDWMLGAFLLLRREMLDELRGFDEGFRLYGEDVDLCYRAARAGWERWYVPGATVWHGYPAVIDHAFLTRRTVWHWRGIARFVRKHPERLRAL